MIAIINKPLGLGTVHKDKQFKNHDKGKVTKSQRIELAKHNKRVKATGKVSLPKVTIGEERQMGTLQRNIEDVVEQIAAIVNADSRFRDFDKREMILKACSDEQLQALRVFCGWFHLEE